MKKVLIEDLETVRKKLSEAFELIDESVEFLLKNKGALAVIHRETEDVIRGPDGLQSSIDTLKEATKTEDALCDINSLTHTLEVVLEEFQQLEVVQYNEMARDVGRLENHLKRQIYYLHQPVSQLPAAKASRLGT